MSAERFQAVQGIERAGALLQQHGFGDFELEPPDRQFGGGERALHHSDQVLAAELRGRQIDRELDVVGPGGGVGAGLAQDPFAERADQPDFLRERNEFVGRNHSAFRMPPAHQSLDTAGAQRDDIDDALIVNLEFLARDRVAQIHFERAPQPRFGIHLVLEEAVIVAAFALGAIEREVGILQELRRVGAVVRRNGDADGNADDDLVALDLVGLADQADQALGEIDGLLPVVVVDLLQDGEFVAAEPADRVALAHRPLQPPRHGLEQRVADRMAERVVDRLELIEVEHENREAFALARQPV